jgi:hypothetical protein
VSTKKPLPVVFEPVRQRCPICGKPSYSRTGTHPQCSVARADAIARAAQRASGAVAEPKKPRQQWSKTCPKCGRQIPSRRFVCDCGHTFEPATKA